LKFDGTLYYCSQCRKIIKTLDDMLFVEEGTPRGFCCESCIESFYAPIVLHFEELEKQYRKELNLNNELCLTVLHSPTTEEESGESQWSLLMDQAIHHPDEIYRSENQLKEEFFVLIKHFNDPNWGKFSMLIMSFLFDQQVSFILAATVTSSQTFLDRYRFGEKQQMDLQSPDASGVQKMDIDQETIEMLDHKKSVFLAEMIEERSPADIPIEQFNLYDDYFVPTLEAPDEIFLFKDREGDEIYIYIKAHDNEGVSFYYVILCFKYRSNMTNAQDTVLPILAFPTVDGEIYHNYRRGTLITGQLKN